MKAKIESMEELKLRPKKSKPELRNSNVNAAHADYSYSSVEIFESVNVANHTVFAYSGLFHYDVYV